MKHWQTFKEFGAFFVGIIIGGFITNQILLPSHQDQGHQITKPGEYHIHSDFLVYIGDEKIDFNQEEFMTDSSHKHHEHVHLHDNNGDVVHLHAPNITLSEFFSSINFSLTSECFSLPDATQYCSNETETLQLFVNSKEQTDIVNYTPADDDAVLLYYGPKDAPQIQIYLNEVSNDSCYYSGTCPERGVAPNESCGLTCEL